MKILLFAESIRNSAGIERMTISLANELISIGHKVNIVVCGTNTSSFYKLYDGISVFALGTYFHEKVQSIKKFRRLAKQLIPDIVINVAIPMGQISIPALAFSYNSPPIIAWEHFHLYAGSFAGRLFRLLSAMCCSKTVVLTYADKKRYYKCLQDKIICIYNFTSMTPPTEKKERQKVVLTVGRLELQKGYDILLPLWKNIIENLRDWKLVIIGDGSQKAILQNMINRSGITDSVEVLSPTPNVYEYYQTASLYAMTSRFEGLPMVLIEAKMNGLPIISFDCPNGPSEIIRNGTDGYVIPMGNNKLFAECMFKVMKDIELREKFSEQCLKDAQNRFSVYRIINQWDSLFKELLNN